MHGFSTRCSLPRESPGAVWVVTTFIIARFLLLIVRKLCTAYGMNLVFKGDMLTWSTFLTINAIKNCFGFRVSRLHDKDFQDATLYRTSNCTECRDEAPVSN